MTKRDPINPTDDSARGLAKSLLGQVRFGALAVTHAETQTPYVARVAMIWRDQSLLTLISTLSTHTKALQANPSCAVLIGEPGDKGDPLTHPRVTISANAALADKAEARNHWLSMIPKAQVYYDFSDFLLYQLDPIAIDLNGGFGKAYRLSPQELTS